MISGDASNLDGTMPRASTCRYFTLIAERETDIVYVVAGLY